jgi:hypothetical protein
VLIREKLVYRIYQIENSSDLMNTEYGGFLEKTIIYQAPTRALLFSRIEEVINELCMDHIPLFFGIPITNFSSHHTGLIMAHTQTTNDK